VINMSVGRSRVTGRSAALFNDAIQYATRHGVVVVAAAGNSSQDRAVVTPANLPGVVAVSAVDRTGRFRPDVSVSGAEVALTAPGVGIVTADEAERNGRPLSPNGTSYSAALVSGVIALVRAKYPDLPAADLVNLVLTTARPAGPEGRDPEYGYGIVDPVAALTANLPAPSKPAPTTAAQTPDRGSYRWYVAVLAVLPLGLASILWWRRRTR
jgi:subtilisin family serine protease